MSRKTAVRWIGPIWLMGSVALAATAEAADWPCFRGNAQRTAVAAETLEFPMRAAWVFEPTHPPSPAYVKSVRLQEEGSWATRRGERAQQGTYEPATHDYSFYPAVAGGRAFYASSTDEGVHCLDAATGRPLWSFYTEGAIRLAPHVAGNGVYATPKSSRSRGTLFFKLPGRARKPFSLSARRLSSRAFARKSRPNAICPSA